MYAMDWRNYMPDIARFASPDPLGMIIPDWTPYRFAFNNPVYFSDPSGLSERGPQVVSDWIKDTNTGAYKFDPNAKGPESTPAGFEYVGPTGSYTDKNGDTVHLLAGGGKETELREVTVNSSGNGSSTLDYVNFLNDRIGDAGSLLEHRPNQGGSIAFWTTTASNRSFDGINYSRLNLRYYRNNWRGNGFTGPTRSVSKYLSKGSVVASVLLGAIEVGNGVADDVND